MRSAHCSSLEAQSKALASLLSETGLVPGGAPAVPASPCLLLSVLFPDSISSGVSQQRMRPGSSAHGAAGPEL